MLYNPYHDTVGKFTDRAHAGSSLPNGRYFQHGPTYPNVPFRIADATALAYEKMGQAPGEVHVYNNTAGYASAVCGSDAACAIGARGTLAINKDGNIHVGPRGVKAMNQNRKFGEYMIAHEAMHSRKRADGRAGPDLTYEKLSTARLTRKSDGYARAFARKDVEEGAGDALVRRNLGLKPNYWQTPTKASYYQGQMGALAIVAGMATGWNREEAWKLIDRMHANINNDAFMFKIFEQAFGRSPKGGWNGRSYYQAMKSLEKTAHFTKYRSLGWLFGG